MPEAARIFLRAPAKVNLNLFITGRREDGYHEVVTRMQKLDLCDHLTIEKTSQPGIFFSCDDQSLPDGSDNLTVQAAQAFLAAAACEHQAGVALRLEKKIPVAAGLGGGSSDAGTVLRGLNQLFGEPLAESVLLELAVSLGADVAFFTIADSAVVATGIGDKLTRVPVLEGYWFVLINPGIHVSTRWVFENFALTTQSKNSTVTGFLNAGSRIFSLEHMHNDLEPVTVSRHPVVGTIKEALLAVGAEAAMMSGSGPTVFGLFAEDSEAEEIKERLAERFSLVQGARVFVTRTYAGA